MIKYSHTVTAVLIVSLAVAAALGTPADAASRKLTLALGVAANFPQGSMNDLASADSKYDYGWGLSGAAGFSLAGSPLGFRGEIGSDNVSVQPSWFGRNTDEGYARTYGASAQMVLCPPWKLFYVPYGLVGVGAYKVSKYYHRFGSDDESDYSAVKPGFVIGAGVKLHWRSYGVYGEWRYMKVSSAVTFSRISFGVAYN